MKVFYQLPNYDLHSLEIFRDGLQSKMVLIFTKLQTDKQDVIGVADFKTLSNKKNIRKILLFVIQYYKYFFLNYNHM